MNEHLPETHTTFQTLADLLSYRAYQQPERCLYTFLVDGESKEAKLTYSELDRQALMIGSRLQKLGATGKAVLLLYPPGLDYIAAFFGCAYAGAVAVPAYPPRQNRHDLRFQTIVADAEAAVILTTQSLLMNVRYKNTDISGIEHLDWIATDTLSDDEAQVWQRPVRGGDTLAFLQYTSGSTASPKGVMLTHKNLLYNLSLIKHCFEAGQDSCGVIWLPPYHDMGLIGGILQPLYSEFPVILMSPTAFLQRPQRWLQAISRYQATISGGPNFAYDLCVRNITPEQRSSLDLSSWKVAFNGAEPIHPETLEQFCSAFGPSGFRRAAFYPCYGLAEATLIVSGGLKAASPEVHVFQQAALNIHRAREISKEDENMQSLVSCGQNLPGQHIIIAHPETQKRCLPDQVGEIWIAGPSVAQGYWKKFEETQQVFNAYLRDTGEGPFLRTGDLGFLRRGALFVTGRLKDLIIIRGRNYYPQDIERTVEQSHISLRSGYGAAFSIERTGEERLVIIYEIERQFRFTDSNEVIKVIRQSVSEEYSLQLYAVVLIRYNSIPKTSSGKIQRYACRAAFLQKSLEVIRENILEVQSLLEENHSISVETLLALDANKRRTTLLSYVQQIVAAHPGISTLELDIHLPLTTLGIDSLIAAELNSHIETDLGVEIPVVSILQGATMSQLATLISDQLEIPISRMAKTSPSVQYLPLLQDISQDRPLQLSFEQERLWFLNCVRPGNAVYTIPCAIHLMGQLNLSFFIQSFNKVFARHEALQTTFVVVDGKPTPKISRYGQLDLAVIDLREILSVKREIKARQLASEEVQRPFDLSQGPLIRVRLMQLDPHDAIVVISVHHIIADIASLSILLREVADCYTALSCGQPSQKGPPSSRYNDFVVWQRLQGETLERRLMYWKEVFSRAPVNFELPVDRPRPTTRTFRGAHQLFILPPELLESLRERSHQDGATLFMALLAIWKIALFCYTKQEKIPIFFPVSGRTRPEFENVIGFFAHPLLLYTDLSGDPSYHEVLARVREQALQAYIHQDVPFAKIAQAAGLGRGRKSSPFSSIMFSYVKNPLAGIAFPALTLQPTYIENGVTDFDLFLTLVEDREGLHGWLGYDTDIFDPGTIARLVKSYCRILEKSVQAPETKLSSFQYSEDLEDRGKKATGQEKKPMLAIAATFTAEPVADILTFWMKKLDKSYEIKFAPYNQVFQQLLDPSSWFFTNRQGVNILLVQFEGWQGGGIFSKEKVEQNVKYLVTALKSAALGSAAPYLLCICPASASLISDPIHAAFCVRMEEFILSEMEERSNIYLVTTTELSKLYPVSAYYDALSDKLGHIPYTPPFFAALGTMIMRRCSMILREPYKVIVLDCDQVLWSGSVGEDGVQGIGLDAARRMLQQCMVAQYTAGMLICLCSKNNEEDIIEVFECHTDMPLKRDHIVSWRINWKAKSENIHALADELQLGLESFIFIDDNPVEVAEVQIHCPGILALQLPLEEVKIPRFLQHVWAFDHLKSTDEDKKRTLLYKENRERKDFQQASLTFREFLSGLELDIQIIELLPPHIPRVSQLTLRTNRFNCTLRRRSEGELLHLYQTGTEECCIVKARDRFGEYGLVGVLIFSVEPEVIKLDTFLLSCRVLGRGIEHRMLTKLGEFALARGINLLEIPYISGKKNQLALDFLEAVGARFKYPQGDGWIFKFSAQVAAGVAFP